MKRVLRGMGILGIIGVLVGAAMWIHSRGSRPVALLASPTVRVVTSFYPLEFLVHRIGGEDVSVTTIVPPGAEPHDYELTARDIANMQEADIVFFHGTLEPWVDKVSTILAEDTGHALVVRLSDGLLTREAASHRDHGVDEQAHDEGSGEDHDSELVEGGLDPHIWLSPELVRVLGTRVTEHLSAYDPIHASAYRARMQTLDTELQSLHQEFVRGLAQCDRKDFVTTHDAFGYLADAYRLRQVPLAGLSPDAEPSPQDMASVVSFARANNVTHIFFETLVSPKLAETVARSVGAKTSVLNPLEGLTAEDIASGKNFMTVMQDNLNNLRTALNCQ